MKRMIACILALALCMSLAACGASEEEKAFEAASALLEAGDYEGALEAFYAIQDFEGAAEKIQEIEEQLRREKLAFLVGTWKDLATGTAVVIAEDGAYSAAFAEGGKDGMALYQDDGTLFILEETAVEEIDGVTHLVSENYDLVPEAAYEELAPKTVDITMDNWETYFEMRLVRNPYDVDGSELFCMGYGIFLREEYQRKLNGAESVNVTFKAQTTVKWRYVEGEKPDWTLTDEAFPYGWNEGEIIELTIQVSLRDSEKWQRSDYYGMYAADFARGIVSDQNARPFIDLHDELTVVDVTGTLTLMP